jgi:hypothetical protein
MLVDLRPEAIWYTGRCPSVHPTIFSHRVTCLMNHSSRAIMSIMLIMSCYTGFFNVRRGWQSLNTGSRFYLRLIRRTGGLWIYTSCTTDGRPFKPKKLSIPFLFPGVPAGFVWCLDNWSRILSGKPFNAFSMTRLKTLQFRLTLTPLFTATHAFVFSHSPFFFMICDWGSPSFLCRRIFFILVTLDLCLLLIHRDLWNSQKCYFQSSIFVVISVNRELDFFFWDSWPETRPPPPFKKKSFSSMEKVFKMPPS